MPKQKTHKGMKKRFKVSSKGKVKHRSASRGHLLSHKSGKQKRQLRKDGALTTADAKEVRENLAPGS
jgi:large subunit ribosomal protein L35